MTPSSESRYPRPPVLHDGAGRLTEFGRQFVTDWLKCHNNNVGLLVKHYPGVHHAARVAGMTDEEIALCCQMGTAQAAIKYDPEKGAFSTILTSYLRHAVQKGIDQHNGCSQRTRRRVGEVLSLDYDCTDDTLSALLPCKDPEHDDRDDTKQAAELVERIIVSSDLGKRAWRAITLRHGIGCEPHTLQEVGRALGVTRERARQILEHSYQLVRRYHEQQQRAG